MTPIPTDEGRRRYLDLHARCHQAFTPFAPIQLPDFFAGRLDVVRRVVSELGAPGRQVAIIGERGVGKTSLAALLTFFTEFPPERSHIVRCGHDSTFDSIFFEFLDWYDAALTLESSEESSHLQAGLGAGAVKLGGDRTRRRTFRAHSAGQQITSNRVLRVFSTARALLVIDELDRVQDAATHTRLAELVKAFSDSASTSKIAIIGVADSIRDLIGEHTSLSRSLAQIRLERMDRPELEEIIRRGAERIGLEFDPRVAQRIITLADGFPHYVHLIALYAALRTIEALLENPDLEHLHVGEAAYEAGVAEALQNSEQTLIDAYENAVVTPRRKSDVYELILQGISMSPEPVAQVQTIAQNASTIALRELKPAQLSTALGKLTQEDRGRVLSKVRDGYYKFSNPLMRAYVRLLLDHRYRGQLTLPFFETG